MDKPLYTPQEEMAALGIDIAECTCPYEYKSPGVLYGISFMKQWIRMQDNPRCPMHGTGVI